MHVPVLQKEVVRYLEPRPNKNFIDATCGGAGHALAILEKTAPAGKVLGIDRDPDMIKSLASQVKPSSKGRLVVANANFADLKDVVQEKRFRPIQGILFDLGMSSWHLEKSQRGFSFLRNEPLDMRYNPSDALTAAKILNYWSEQDIEKILREFGEEKFSRAIAKAVVSSRKLKPLRTTFQLVEVVKGAVPGRYLAAKIHFATRTFQALRIAVNQELESIRKTLPQALDILTKGGKLVVISFHSLEDRIVKNFLKEESQKGTVAILTKKPITPGLEEIKINPRSRSAKLRAAQKL